MKRWLMGAIIGLLLCQIPMAQAVVEPCANPSWTGEFYTNPTLGGSPLHTICRRTIDFIWGGGVPYAGVEPGNFSTRWQSTQAFPAAGRYEFRVVFQGSSRVLVNDIPVIEAMTNSAEVQVVSQEAEILQAHAPVQITVESFHSVSEARIKLDWFLVSGGTAGATDDHRRIRDISTNSFSAGGGNAWSGVYFDNAAFDSPPKNPSYAPADGLILNYNEVLQNPATGSGDLQWSSRWTRTVDFPAGSYTFYFRVDDLGRVLLDGQEIINQIQAEGQVAPATVEISAGRHEITVEHVKLNQTGGVFLTWEPPIGTMLLPNGCNAVEVAGFFGNAELCPNSPIAALTSATTSIAGANAPVNFVSIPLLVQAGPLNFRPEPNTNNQPISRLRRGENYAAIGRTADNIWVQVEVDELVGWVQSQYIRLDGDINSLPVSTGGQLAFGQAAPPNINTFSPDTSGVIVAAPNTSPNPTAANLAAIAQRDLSLYSAASEQAATLGVIPVGLPVSILGKTSDSLWVLVLLPNGLQGWSRLDGYDILPEQIPIIG